MFCKAMSVSAEPVIKYLRLLQEQGQTHVSVDDEARVILREFYRRARGGVVQPVAPAKTADVRPVVQSTVAQPKTTPAIKVSGGSAIDQIASLKQQSVNLSSVRALGTLRNTLVFSVGNPSADVMLIGEAPGFDDERLGEPFVGKAGQKLDGILKAMGLSREESYLTNLVKYRPSIPNQTTMNRRPSIEEIAACLPVFKEELKIVKPKVIIALGVTVAQYLMDSTKSISDLRGEFYEYQGVPLRVTYHPSYILQEGATPEKRELWEDMLAVMDLLKMPINEKQRGYFLPK